MIIEEFGDREIYAATEHALERGMSLHEVIAIEMGTLTLPLEDAVAWVREHVTVRPGFREFAEQHRPVILSSGFTELIEPVLEREGVSLEVHANRARRACRRLASDLARRRAVRGVRGGVQAGRASHGSPVVYVGDGYSDRCAALAADRVFARDGLVAYLEREGRRRSSRSRTSRSSGPTSALDNTPQCLVK